MLKITPPKFPGITGNELKTAVQNYAVDNFMMYRKVLFQCYVGFGKTKIGEDCIQRMLLEFKPEDEVIIICPSAVIGMWSSIVARISEGSRLFQYKVLTPNGYTVTDKDKQWEPKMLIVDECHRIARESSEFFSTALLRTTCDNIALLSGTIEQEHITFFNRQGISAHYHVSKLWGYKNNLIPEYSVIAIPVSLTPDEMSEYMEVHVLTEKLRLHMAKGFIYSVYETDQAMIERAADILEWSVGKVRGHLKRWRAAYSNRSKLLYNARNKMSLLLRILAEVEEPILIYCMTQEFADEVQQKATSTISVHSGQTKARQRKAKEAFDSGIYQNMISIGQFKEAINNPKLRIGIRAAFSSTTTDNEQIGGRFIRLDEENPDKEAYLFYLYVADFEAHGQVVNSQDQKWLKNSLKHEHNVVVMKTALEGLNFVKQIVGK